MNSLISGNRQDQLICQWMWWSQQRARNHFLDN